MLETASSLTGARGAALIRADLVRARSLGVLRGVLADQIGAAFLELLETLAVESDAARIGSVYGRLFGLLAEEAELYPEPLVGDGWQNHLLDRLLADENAFSRKAQRADFEQIGAALLAQTRCDLVTLRALFSLDAERLARAAAHAAGAEPVEPWVSWRDFSALGTGPPLHTPAGRELKSRLAAVADWPPLAPELAAYYARVGAGLFGRYRAFRWLHNSPHGGGHLEGVPEPDPIRLEQLIGYDSERELVLQNTEQFLAGFPANSVLFYGDRGTGKSSTVKALLNAYAERGLRLVEVAKDDLADFPRIIALLRDRPEPSSCSSTTSRSTSMSTTTVASRRSWKAASRLGRPTSCCTPRPTGAIWSRSAGVTASPYSRPRSTARTRFRRSCRCPTASASERSSPRPTRLAIWRSWKRSWASGAWRSILPSCGVARCSGPSGTTAAAAARRASSSTTLKGSWRWRQSGRAQNADASGSRPGS